MTYENRAEAYQALTTTRGSEFEVGREVVLGNEVDSFLNLPSNLGTLLNESPRYHDRPYLIAGDRSFSFTEHHRIVRNLAWILRNTYDLAPGDRVAIFAFNCPEWIMAFWAVTYLGGIVVAGNSMGVSRELQHQIDLTGPTVVLSDSTLAERLNGCDLKNSEHVDLIAIVQEAEQIVGCADIPQASVSLDDPAVIIFTSGTTGQPKGATHTHRNVITAVWFHKLNDAVAAAMGSPPSPRRFLLASPMFHIASLHNLSVVRLVTGDTAVMQLGRFDGAEALKLIEKHRITNWGAVPTMISRVLREDLNNYDLSSLRVLTVNSAPSSPSLQANTRKRLPHVAEAFGTSYGLTESSTAVTIATPQMLANNPECVGRPIVTMEAEVRDNNGVPVPEGTEGEVYIRGPLVMRGYWGEPGRSGIDAHGWFATGDLGYFADGLLHMRSRRTDLILRGGQNIYPAEVANVLSAFTHVKEAHVVGLPDPDYGQKVAAFVVVEDVSTFDKTAFETYLETELARYKRPSVMHFLEEELPKNATGKVMVHKLDLGVFKTTEKFDI